MSTMIENVARAICGQACLRNRIMGKPCVLPDGRNGPCEATMDQLCLSNEMNRARAAVEALREPSEGMRRAAYVAGDMNLHRDGGWSGVGCALYTAMIDHILTEPTEKGEGE